MSDFTVDEFEVTLNLKRAPARPRPLCSECQMLAWSANIEPVYHTFSSAMERVASLRRNPDHVESLFLGDPVERHSGRAQLSRFEEENVHLNRIWSNTPTDIEIIWQSSDYPFAHLEILVAKSLSVTEVFLFFDSRQLMVAKMNGHHDATISFDPSSPSLGILRTCQNMLSQSSFIE